LEVNGAVILGWLVPVGFILAFLLILSYLTRQRQPLRRKPSFEGIEPPGLVRAYDFISRTPQFTLLRLLVVSQLKRYHPSGHLVDIGCGPGYLLGVIGRRFRRLHLMGIDISQTMIEAAHRSLAHRGLGDRVAFRQGDIERLPLQGNSVDFVVSTFSLHHWTNPLEALREVHRVLKPKGQFLLFDLRRDARSLIYWFLRFATTFVVPQPLRQVKEPLGSLLASYTAREMQTYLAKVAFRKTSISSGPIWLFVCGQKG
jgi:ubiquinone/menaquinone biosynthesis C-methylase UbiE